MADADEDDFGLGGGDSAEVDDETQDFRFLNALSFNASGNVTIPKRGEKDFEAHSTSLQISTLEASREAMRIALVTPRIHKPKSHSIGYYDAKTNMAAVYNAKGQYIMNMGQQRGARLWLLPEEALHLLERGDIDLRWPVAETQGEEQQEANVSQGVPMSLQGAYAAFLSAERADGRTLTLEMYTVYSALKRTGYRVMRADDWCEPMPALDRSSKPKEDFSLAAWLQALFSSSPKPQQLAAGPVVKPGLYRNYNEVYKSLRIIPFHDPTKPPSFALAPTTPNPYRITYHVWKPSTPFRKSARPKPDFRIAVINARETPVPTLSQINDLLATTPYDPPPKGQRIEQAIKQGHRNVVLAVVDQGIASYIKMSDAGFGADPLYERKATRGGKRGGMRGGRGSARGGRGGARGG